MFRAFMKNNELHKLRRQLHLAETNNSNVDCYELRQYLSKKQNDPKKIAVQVNNEASKFQAVVGPSVVETDELYFMGEAQIRRNKHAEGGPKHDSRLYWHGRTKTCTKLHKIIFATDKNPVDRPTECYTSYVLSQQMGHGPLNAPIRDPACEVTLHNVQETLHLFVVATPKRFFQWCVVDEVTNRTAIISIVEKECGKENELKTFISVMHMSLSGSIFKTDNKYVTSYHCDSLLDELRVVNEYTVNSVLVCPRDGTIMIIPQNGLHEVVLIFRSTGCPQQCGNCSKAVANDNLSWKAVRFPAPEFNKQLFESYAFSQPSMDSIDSVNKTDQWVFWQNGHSLISRMSNRFDTKDTVVVVFRVAYGDDQQSICGFSSCLVVNMAFSDLPASVSNCVSEWPLQLLGHRGRSLIFRLNGSVLAAIEILFQRDALVPENVTNVHWRFIDCNESFLCSALTRSLVNMNDLYVQSMFISAGGELCTRCVISQQPSLRRTCIVTKCSILDAWPNRQSPACL